MPFVSRAGQKLDHALVSFALDVTGFDCADFGSNVGGFTDCLLQRGAASVVAIDTGYGVLDWRLRNDPRVTVRERTNALHAEAPPGGVDLVVIDLAWTPQRYALPAALRWLRPTGMIVTLVKPHYELAGRERTLLVRGALPHAEAPGILHRVMREMPEHGLRPLAWTQSPLEGGKSRRRSGAGNLEYLVLGVPIRHGAGTAPMDEAPPECSPQRPLAPPG